MLRDRWPYPPNIIAVTLLTSISEDILTKNSTAL
jgi:hypothetical protein